LLAGGVTIMLSLKINNTLLVVGLGMSTFVILNMTL